jgi:hypothetical protein
VRRHRIRDGNADGERLARESLVALRVASGDHGQYFQRDIAAEPRVARPIDLAHAGGTERAHDFVGAETWSLPEACAGRFYRGCSYS